MDVTYTEPQGIKFSTVTGRSFGLTEQVGHRNAAELQVSRSNFSVLAKTRAHSLDKFRSQSIYHKVYTRNNYGDGSEPKLLGELVLSELSGPLELDRLRPGRNQEK